MGYTRTWFCPSKKAFGALAKNKITIAVARQSTHSFSEDTWKFLGWKPYLHTLWADTLLSLGERVCLFIWGRHRPITVYPDSMVGQMLANYIRHLCWLNPLLEHPVPWITELLAPIPWCIIVCIRAILHMKIDISPCKSQKTSHMHSLQKSCRFWCDKSTICP